MNRSTAPEVDRSNILMTMGAASGNGRSITFGAGGEGLGARAGAQGSAVTGPVDTRWFTTDVSIEDPDGNRIIFAAPRMSDRAAAVEWGEQNISGDSENSPAEFNLIRPTGGPQ